MSVIEHLSHLGLCVADLEVSRHFYMDVLGFRELGGLRASGRETARLLGLDGADLRALYLERDGLRLELLQFAAPEATGGAEPRPMNARGLTHLSLRVADLTAAGAAIEAAGGRILAATHVEIAAARSRVVFALDPDGTRLELLEAPGDPKALPIGPA